VTYFGDYSLPSVVQTQSFEGWISFIIDPGIETEYKFYFLTPDDGNKFIF
jgi:hypothetical protein